MYGFIDIGGKQYKVEKGKKFDVFNLNKKVEDIVEFNPVCFFDDKDLITEEDKLKNISIICKVLEEKKGEKIYVFKKKAKTGYKKGYGHRDHITVLKVEDIKIK
ncbi:MAG TPA: 50S ribosomal protein L21 [Candidatus Ratteibacteria bacterium]|nr:50S ribosomal protein L21 [bacterium]HRR95514.1 50S ribosomal protein L21 [Candidatus Ratteibacteria bacterium]